jgi:hypothetical protein
MGRAETTPTRIEAQEVARRQEQEVLDESKFDFHA